MRLGLIDNSHFYGPEFVCVCAFCCCSHYAVLQFQPGPLVDSGGGGDSSLSLSECPFLAGSCGGLAIAK